MRLNHLLAAAAGLVSAAQALITVGYYPSWNESAVEGADLSPYSHINIAFGIPTTEGGIYYDESLFAPIVGKIHAHGPGQDGQVHQHPGQLDQEAQPGWPRL
ncbi:hypothetical protein NQ176_g11037 [Zarea fungicola]|uniref:Uncharacterized protein n=1 Tax=Zarea fungicola TaxID=93591 RepID=A0ACC1MD17_9HYPO|nr:hypothetical protein NQ176_g11037 [Lecanicillium fungicola]